jgi:predicted RNase H-like nuclease (RuvC/YqgF family)
VTIFFKATTDDNSMYIQQPQAVQNLYNTIVSLQRGLEEQKDSYRNLEERFHRLERENRQLEMTNFKLTQALTVQL